VIPTGETTGSGGFSSGSTGVAKLVSIEDMRASIEALREGACGISISTRPQTRRSFSSSPGRVRFGSRLGQRRLETRFGCQAVLATHSSTAEVSIGSGIAPLTNMAS